MGTRKHSTGAQLGGQKVNSDDIADIMRQYDTDGNGVLDAAEIEAMHAKVSSKFERLRGLLADRTLHVAAPALE